MSNMPSGTGTSVGLDLDAECRHIAQRVLDGELDEHPGRWRIAALISRSDAVERGVRSGVKGSGLSRQTIADLITATSLLIERKIVDPDSSSSLSLERIAGGQSTRGWAHNLARSAVKSELRNLLTAQRIAPSALDATDESGARPIHARSSEGRETASAALANLDGTNEETTSDLTYTHERRSKGLTAEGKLHEGARTLLLYLRLPPVARPRSALRQQLRRLLAADPRCRFVTEAMRLIVDGKDEQVDPAVASIFINWPADVRRAFAERVTDGEIEPRMLKLIVESAFTPTPAPPRRAMRALVDDIAALADSPAWRKLARELVTAFDAVLCEFQPGEPGQLRRPKKATQMTNDNAALCAALATACRFPGQPLGDDINTARSILESRLDGIITDLTRNNP